MDKQSESDPILQGLIYFCYAVKRFKKESVSPEWRLKNLAFACYHSSPSFVETAFN